MRHCVFIAAIVGAIVAAGPVLAAPKPCTTEGNLDAKPIPVESMEQITKAAVSLVMALSPDMTRKIKVKVSCVRGEPFRIGGEEYTLTGENGEIPSRLFVPKRRNAPAFYLAPILDLTKTAGKDEGPAFALALVRLDSQGASSARLYDALPTDAMLRRDVEAALTGALAPIAAMAKRDKTMQVFMPDAPRDGRAQGTPPPGEAGDGPRRLTEADGRYFLRLPDGAAKHALTSFVCPAQINGYRRRDMVVYDATEGGRDVGCGYGEPGDPAWFTFYLTRIPDMSHAEVFDIYVQNAQGATGAGRSVASPVATGAAPKPTSAAFWMGQGLVDGVVLSSIGDWRVKLRISYRPGREAEVANMADTLFTAAYSQINTLRREAPERTALPDRLAAN